MNIATSLNKKYVNYTYVMMKSVLVNNENEDICFYILHSELDDSDMKILKPLTDEYGKSIEFLKVERSKLDGKLPTTEAWSLEAYFRLMLLDLLPSDVDRLLYLDVDVIVDKSLNELYYADFEGQLFAVCKEMPFQGSFPDIRQELFAKQFDNGYQYFNSGVMLWNIEQLRKEGYDFNKYMELAAEINYKVLAPDQDLLNLMHYNRLLYVDEYKYDLFARYAHSFDITYEDVKRETVIVHFPGYKPWSGEFVHFDIERIWWDYAKLTPMYGKMLEEFMESSLKDTETERVMKRLTEEKKSLADECQKMAELIKKVIGK